MTTVNFEIDLYQLYAYHPSNFVDQSHCKLLNSKYRLAVSYKIIKKRPIGKTEKVLVHLTLHFNKSFHHHTVL